MSVVSRIKCKIKVENTRSKRVIVNILSSFFLKGVNIFTNFALVPLTIDYLDKYQYGIWLTFSSIFAWFSLFDLGIGNGLRNKLSIALANEDYKLAKIYVSTSYALISIIFICLIFLFWFVNSWLNWSNILNVSIELRLQLEELAFVLFVFISLRFILGLITNVLFADQKPALNNLIGTLGNVFVLVLILLLKNYIFGSLFWVSIINAAVPLIVVLFFNLVLFSKKYRKFSPSFKFINFNYSRGLLGIGFQFFVIQVAALILFTTSNILLTQFFGPEEVTSYNVAFKYFSVITMVFGIILSPYWSAITEAYFKNDFDWIKSSIKRLEIFALFFVVISFFMFYFSDYIYLLWVGNSVSISKPVSFAMMLFVIISLLGSTSNTFINGVGKIRLQLISAILSIIFTIPLAYLFCVILKFGPEGIILATLCTTLPTMILWRIQYLKIINHKATGIWDK